MRKIGWIGAGIMGQPMVIHLLNKGYEVHVYARHPERVEQAKNGYNEFTEKKLYGCGDFSRGL